MQVEVGGAKGEKRFFLARPNNFGTKIFLMFLLRKCIPHLMFSFTNKKVIGV